jgi:hypothetical protein
LSVLLAVAAQMRPGTDFGRVLEKDLGLSSRSSPIFGVLARALSWAGSVVLLELLSLTGHFTGVITLGAGLPYVVETCSLLCWIVGATGLLMLGGHPYVRLAQEPLSSHIDNRLTKHSANTQIKIEFGSLHGSMFISDRGHSSIPGDVVEQICRLDIQLYRPIDWYLRFIWFTTLLFAGMVLKVVEFRDLSSDVQWLGVMVLMIGYVCRGWGIMGPEEWMIPTAFRRQDTQYGATLVGQIS